MPVTTYMYCTVTWTQILSPRLRPTDHGWWYDAENWLTTESADTKVSIYLYKYNLFAEIWSRDSPISNGLPLDLRNWFARVYLSSFLTAFSYKEKNVLFGNVPSSQHLSFLFRGQVSIHGRVFVSVRPIYWFRASRQSKPIQWWHYMDRNMVDCFPKVRYWLKKSIAQYFLLLVIDTCFISSSDLNYSSEIPYTIHCEKQNRFDILWRPNLFILIKKSNQNIAVSRQDFPLQKLREM